MKKIIIAAFAVILAVVILSAVYADLKPGAKAPSFTLPTLNNKSINLQNTFGSSKVTVLDIWATWCPPCRAEIPYLVNLNKKYAGKGVTFVGVSIDQSKSDVASFVKQKGITYTIALDPQAAKVGKLYGVRGIPVTYVIDKSGVIRYAHTGFSGSSEAAQIDKEIQTLLAK